MSCITNWAYFILFFIMFLLHLSFRLLYVPLRLCDVKLTNLALTGQGATSSTTTS
jgi:hypothetical protein